MNRRRIATLAFNLAPVIIFATVAMIYAYKTSHQSYGFSVFQHYRVVHNNLNHPDVTKYLLMIHPALADRQFVYSSHLTPGYTLTLTLWCKIFGLSVLSLRICSIFHFLLLFAALYAFWRSFGQRFFWPGWMLLLAPQLSLYSISTDNWTTSTAWMLFSIAYMNIAKSDSKSSLWMIFFLGFLSTFMNFKVPILYLLYIFGGMLSDKWSEQGARKVFPGWRNCVWLLAGCSLALMLATAHHSLSPDGAIGLFDYIFMRGEARMTGTDPAVFFKVLSRLYGYISVNYPYFLVMIFPLILYFSSKPNWNERVLFVMFWTHFLYLFLFSKTVIFHFFTLYNIFFIGSMLACWIYIKYWSKWKGRRFFIIFSIFTLSLCSIYEYRRLSFWADGRNSVDAFLEKMDSNDYLICKVPYNTWPLNMNAPEKTLYLDPDSQPNSCVDTESRELLACDETEHTLWSFDISYNPPKVKEIPAASRVYLCTMERISGMEAICSDGHYQVYLLLDKKN
jgi:hypothetical protein